MLFAEIDPSPLVVQSDFLSEASAWRWWAWLHRHVPWRQEEVCLFGKRYPEPRLSAWYGPAYAYSGLPRQATPCRWPLRILMERIYQRLGVRFNSVLITLYRDGHDHVGWHADNESSLGQKAPLAVVSLGVSRRFDVKRSEDKGARWQHPLTHGSLMFMHPGFQDRYKHRLAKSLRIKSPRISLSFRALPTP